jgi:hypothetical protein
MNVFPNPIPPGFILPKPTKKFDQNTTIFPSIAPLPVQFPFDRKLTEEEISGIESDHKSFRIWGIMSYRDAFGTPRITKFDASFGGPDFANGMKNVPGAKWFWRFNPGHNDEQ